MFTSFNSLPVYTAHSLPEQGALRELFEKNGLEYSVSMKDANAPDGFYPAISPDMRSSPRISNIFFWYIKRISRKPQIS